jgi:hypothetical protein
MNERKLSNEQVTRLDDILKAENDGFLKPYETAVLLSRIWRYGPVIGCYVSNIDEGLVREDNPQGVPSDCIRPTPDEFFYSFNVYREWYGGGEHTVISHCMEDRRVLPFNLG